MSRGWWLLVPDGAVVAGILRPLRYVRIFRIGPGSVMQEMSLMSPPQPGHSIHLDEDGLKLLADCIAPERLAVSGLNTTPPAGTVTITAVDARAIQRQTDGSLALPSTDNRVVAIAGGDGREAVVVPLDNERLVDCRECWAVSRPSNTSEM